MSSHGPVVRFTVLFLSSLLSIAAESATERWVPSGPEGGSVWALAFDPGGSGQIFAQVAKVNASTHIGLEEKTSYRFNLDNDSWQALAGNSVDSFAVASGKPLALYAMQDGLIKSVNLGRSWQLVSDTGPTDGRVYIAPSDPSIIYVIPSGEDNPETRLPVLYQSRDGGETWQKGEWPARFISLDTPTAHPGGGVLVIDSTNPEILYATGGGIVAGHYVFYSQDGGQSWEQRTSFTELNSNPRTIIVDPHDSQTLYIAADQNITTNPPPRSDDCNGSGGVFKTSDAGFSWERLPLSECNVRSLVADPLHAGILYAGTENGIYKTTDSGTHWQRVSDEVNTLRLAIDPANPQSLIAGTLMEGVLKTDDGGQHWHWLNKGLYEVSVFDLVIAATDPRILYSGTGAGVYKSTDGGVSWTKTGHIAPIFSALAGHPIASLIIDPRDADVVYATDNVAVYKTIDAGDQWRRIFDGSASVISLSPLQLAPDNADVVYAGADFKSLNRGANWVVNSDILSDTYQQGIVAAVVMPDLTVFAGIESGRRLGSIPAPCLIGKGEGGRLQQFIGGAAGLISSATYTYYPSGVFRKREDGMGWCKPHLPLQNGEQIRVLEFSHLPDHSNQSGVLWAETSHGVYQSTDQGDHWIKTSHLIIPRAIMTDDPDTLYGVINDKPVWSQNNGDSWETFNLDLKLTYPQYTHPRDRHSRRLTYLPDRKVFLSTGLDGIFTYNKPESFISSFKFMAESPVTGTSLSGISTVHGWAFSTQPGVSIEQISFDKSDPFSLDKFDIPCCSQRNDVAAAFPQYLAATNSGWGMAINWSDLAEGEKQIRFKVRDSAGETYISAPKNITITQTAGSSFLDQFNPAQASAKIKGNRLLLNNVSVRDKVTGTVSLINAEFHWSGANQSFQMLAEPAAVTTQTGVTRKQAGSTQAVVAASNGIYSFIDAPVANATVSGIGVIYGWAFPDKQEAAIESIQIRVDGTAYGDIPCCSIRTDVVQSYEQVHLYYPAIGLSGWGVVFNFSTLDAGSHTLQITILSSDGSSVTHQRQILVVKPGGFSFLSDLDLSLATVSIKDNGVVLRNVMVKDKSTQQSKQVNLTLHWVAGLQSLTLVSSETL